MTAKITGRNLALGGICLLVGALLGGAPAQAQSSTSVTVRVTVVAPPPCVINGDRPIEVDFGEVITTRVDGRRYLQWVNYNLECTDSASNTLRMRIEGSGASFDGEVLQTNVADLGILLISNGLRLPLNQWQDFTYPNKPGLMAVPVKRPGAALAGGNFSAGATLVVDYQ
ncbi:fimbrial protein [Zobellella sp. DQSA1]|uniref:fimbrial protein n=1 Tax=Zobellella sp. DQSA1 TaxID=3342386 RepID=UPI0035C1A8A6